jgi:S-adenosylmethionine:tRNA ribosyltransferase-isomerase
VVLHVGTGTFRPVEAEFVEEHPMHSEWCSMTPAAVEAVRGARARGGRVIAVGTTAARTLEAYARALGDSPERGVPESIRTSILITPGHEWRWVDGLLTNFHLPRSTLMALVAALFPGEAGAAVGRLKAVYAEAIARGYRFYSFGDAMLVV